VGLLLTNETITLTGTAPLNVASLRLEQQPTANVIWKDPGTWRFTNIHLQPGPNAFVVKAIDHAGKPQQQATISITRTNLLPARKQPQS
jgi:hypothetical protein